MADSQDYVEPLLNHVYFSIVQLQVDAYARMGFLKLAQQRRHMADSEGYRRTDP